MFTRSNHRHTSCRQILFYNSGQAHEAVEDVCLATGTACTHGCQSRTSADVGGLCSTYITKRDGCSNECATPHLTRVTYILLAMFTACKRLCPYNRLVAKNPFGQPAIVGVIYIISDEERPITTTTTSKEYCHSCTLLQLLLLPVLVAATAAASCVCM